MPLLDQHLDQNYITNFHSLGRFYSLTTRHSISYTKTTNIAKLAEDFICLYKQLYYRKDPKRLPMCTVNIHYLIHFASYIQDCGPTWYWWQFPIKHFCNIIKLKAHSKSQFNASLINIIIITKYLNYLQFTRAVILKSLPTVVFYLVFLNYFKLYFFIY